MQTAQAGLADVGFVINKVANMIKCILSKTPIILIFHKKLNLNHISANSTTVTPLFFALLQTSKALPFSWL